MTSAENVSKISIANSAKAPDKTTGAKKRDAVPEDLGLGIVEETCKAAAESARNTAKELQEENKTINISIKTLTSAAAKIANKILKLENQIENAAEQEADTAKYEQEVKQLQKEQKEYQNDIKDSEKQITANNQAAQEAEKKAEIEDKKAEDAKKEAEIKAEAEAKAIEEAEEAENQDIKADETEETETLETAETNEENEESTTEISSEETLEENTDEAAEIEDSNEQNIENETIDTEETLAPVDTTVPPVIDEIETPEENTVQTGITTEIQDAAKEEINTYLDSIVNENPIIKEEFNVKDLAQEIEIAEIVEAVQTYEEIGVAVDAETLVKASVAELDAIVETAVVQEVLKTTATGKKMGAIANITSKKEMKENKEAADEFQANFITLQSYYNANNVYNVAAEGFIALGSEMYTNLSQGATYDTSKLNEASNTAVNLTSTIQSDVTNSNLTIDDADVRYEETRTKAEDALDKARETVGKDEENTSIDSLEAEFLTITSNYRNATADSEKQETITNLLEIITKANTLEENPESKISTDERLVVTL